MNWFDFLKRWGGVIAAAVLLILVALLFWFMMVPGGVDPQTVTIAQPRSALQEWLRAALVTFLGVSFVALAIFFPILFRAELNTNDERKNERRIRRVILYSYSVAAISLGGSLVPFLFIPSSFPGLYELMMSSPVGIVLGCSADAKKTAGEEPELSCARDESEFGQWVVNIGGMIPEHSKQEALAQTQAPGGSPAQETPRPKPRGRVKIQGGLVIPLYFIVLSLIGGAISLTRRVPEYQRRYSENYVPTPDKPKLDRAMVREFMAFQIIQFISAPLLAVIAYYLISPVSKSSLVVLGFTAGFGSEAILLMIRALFEKVSPAPVSVAQTGSASGNVVDAAAGTAVAGATVSVVGKATLKTQTDARGHFVIEGIPVGDQVIEASLAARTAMAKVAIGAGKTAVCHIPLP